MQTGPDFFVSYTEVDRSWAEWIAWVLESVGWRVVIQAWDFGPGSHFVGEMHQAAQDAKRTVAVLSQAYLNSAFGAREWQAAWAADPVGQGRKLLVVRIEDCERPGLLGQIVSVDIFDTDESTAKESILNAARSASGIGRMKPSAAPRFPLETRTAVKVKPFPGSPGVHEDGESASLRRDLIISTKWNADGIISISYRVNDAVPLESAIDFKYAAQLAQAISSDHERMRVRFGSNSVATIEALARQFSEIFLPPEVVSLIRLGRIDRLRVIADESAPCLPWELAHDGNDFLALNISVLHSTREVPMPPRHPRGRTALMVEGVPRLYGVAAGYFPPDADLSIRRDDIKVTRIRVRNRHEFMYAIAKTPCDLLFLDFHSSIGRDGRPAVLVDEPIDLRSLINQIAQSAPEVVVLSACQTSYGDVTYAGTAAFQTARASGGYVLGVIGWLGIATAQRFADLFPEFYLDMKDVERAVLQTRRELFRENCRDWWNYSLYGPA